MTCIAFSIKFAKTNYKIAENSEICENYSKLFKIIQYYSFVSQRVTLRGEPVERGHVLVVAVVDLAAARQDPLDDLPVAFVDRPEQDAPPAVVLLVYGPLFYITLRKDPLALPL